MFDIIKRNAYIIWQQLSKGILHVFTANVLNKIILMASNMILTRMLSQNEYGILSFIGNVYSYAGLIMGFGLVAGALQFGIENHNHPEENCFYKYCANAGLLVNVLIVFIFFVVVLIGKFSIHQVKIYICIYLPLLIIEYFIQLLFIILRSQSRFKDYARLITMQTILVFVGTCIGSFWGVKGVIASKYVVSFVVFFTVVGFIYDTICPILRAGKLNMHQKKELWHYSIFNGISSILNQLLFLIDFSMLAKLIGSTQILAIYKVATLIPNALKFIPQSVVICVVPNIVAHNKDPFWLKKMFKKTFVGMLIFNLLIGLCFILFAPLVIYIIAGKQYLVAVGSFRVLIAGYCIAGTFRSLSVNFLAALKMVKWNAILSLISCLIAIMLNFLLIPKFGMIGAAYATFGVELTSSILTFVCLMYKLKKSYQKKEVYINK